MILEKGVLNSSQGLADSIFNYIRKTTLLVNGNILVKDEDEHTLLVYRDDQYVGFG